MAVYTQVSAEALGEFLTRYDVGDLVSAKGIAEGVENSNYLVDTTQGRFILTLYEKRVEAGDLPYFMALLDHLAAKGLPVPPAIRDRDGVAIQELAGRPACLITFLPGVSVTHPTPQQARAAGEAMGDMHCALEDFGGVRPNALGLNEWAPLLDRCGPAIDAIQRGLYADLREYLTAVLAAIPADLPQSTIHADLFPDNVLMRGDAVTGLIDFYFACTDARAYDVAIMHSAWAFSADGSRFDFDIAQALMQGYRARIALTSQEEFALPWLAAGASIRFCLTRAYDWINTPPEALVTRKDPLAYLRRLETYLGLTGDAFI